MTMMHQSQIFRMWSNVCISKHIIQFHLFIIMRNALQNLMIVPRGYTCSSLLDPSTGLLYLVIIMLRKHRIQGDSEVNKLSLFTSFILSYRYRIPGPSSCPFGQPRGPTFLHPCAMTKIKNEGQESKEAIAEGWSGHRDSCKIHAHPLT